MTEKQKWFRTFIYKHYFTQPNPQKQVEEYRKRLYLALITIITFPLFILFGVSDISEGHLVEGIVAITIGSGFLAVAFLLRRVKNIRPLLRIVALGFLLFTTYIIAIGGGQGLSFIWYYLYPVTAFFLLGKREGAFWVLLSLGLITILILGPKFLGTHSYSPAVTVRFLVTISLIAILSYGIESSRYAFYNQLLREKKELEAAAKKINILGSLLPICSHCKKIRDDKGYWKQIEDFFSDHAVADFTHSICPSCARTIYGETDKE